MNESGCARAVGQSIAKAGRNFFRRMTKLEIAAVVSGSKTRLRKMIPLVRDFLREQLGLELNMDKVAIYSAYRGVEFLGITSHFAAYKLRLGWINGPLAFSFQYGYYRSGLLRYRLHSPCRLSATKIGAGLFRNGCRDGVLPWYANLMIINYLCKSTYAL